jgi:hypothetical protein
VDSKSSPEFLISAPVLSTGSQGSRDTLTLLSRYESEVRSKYGEREYVIRVGMDYEEMLDRVGYPRITFLLNEDSVTLCGVEVQELGSGMWKDVNGEEEKELLAILTDNFGDGKDVFFLHVTATKFLTSLLTTHKSIVGFKEVYE